MAKRIFVLMVGLVLGARAWATPDGSTQACLASEEQICNRYPETYYPGSTVIFRTDFRYAYTCSCFLTDGVTEAFLRGTNCGPLNASSPPLAKPPEKATDAPAKQCGSIISVDSRSVGEAVPITGTPFSLNYSSERVVGRKSDYKLRIPLVGAQPVSSLTGVNLTVSFVGRTLQKSFPPTANSFYDFVWDGLDQNGKNVANTISVNISIVEVHSPVLLYNPPIKSTELLGVRRAIVDGLGGWSIDVHHYYDPKTERLFYGDGGIRSMAANKYLNDTRYFLANEDGSEVYIFDLAGHHLQTLNGLTGAVLLSFNYDTQWRIASIVDSYNNKTEITRDTLGNLTGIKSPYGQITKLVPGTTGYLYSISNPKNETYTFTYGTGGLLSKFTKPGGEITTFSYDADGYLIEDNTAGAFIRLLQTAVTDTIKTIEKSTPLGRKTKYEVWPQGSGGVYRTETDPDGFRRTIYDYVTSKLVSNKDGTSYQESRDPDPRYNTAYIKIYSEYYNGGQVTVRDSISETIQTQDYFNFGLMTKKLSRSHGDPVFDTTSTSTYTSSTRLGVHTSFGGRVSKYSIDSFGKPTSSQWANLQPVSYIYDTRGRLSQVKQYLRTTTFGYDLSGNLSSIKDPANLTTSYLYDAANRKTQTTLTDGRIINFNYDKSGNLISLTPPSKPVHSFLYTALGFISKYLAPSLSVGAPTTDTTYTYSLDKELTQITMPDGSLIKFNYSPTTALLTSVTSPLGSSTYTFQNGTQSLPTEIKTYDGVVLTNSYMGAQLLTVTQSGPVKGSFTKYHDAPGRISSATVTGALDTDTSLVDFKYDKDSLMTQAGAEILTYNPTTAALSSSKLANVTDSYTYDAFYGEPSSYLAKFSTANLFSETVARDNLGRIISRTEVISGVTHSYAYTYDTAGRLFTVKIDGVLRSQYEYDTNSNRIKGTFIGTSATSVLNATYDNQDRILTYGSYALTHNANGYLTSQKLLTFTPDTFTYDVFGNLRSASLPMVSKTINYIIDGFNRRVGKKVNGVLKQMFVYQNQLQIAAELDAAGKIVSRFVYSSKANIPDFMIKAGVTYRIISDHLGSPRMVVNASTGTIAQKMEFNEFGGVILDTAPGFQPFGFAGGIYDLDTKLVRFGAREYNAETGRWMAKDPIRFGGGDSNLYGYAWNDPINFTDPMGLWSVSVGAFAGWGGGIIFGQNPNGGGSFVTIRIGAGAGGGVSWDPHGKSPDNACSGVSTGQYAEAGAHFGPLEATVGTNSGFSQTRGQYFNPLGVSAGVVPSIGVGAGINAGVEVTFH